MSSRNCTRDDPHAVVFGHFDRQNSEDLFTTAICAAEMRFGVASLPAGKRRDRLSIVVARFLAMTMRGRVLSFDISCVEPYAVIRAASKAACRPLTTPDSFIAAIALAHNAALWTRNTADFAGCGVQLVNPWIE